MCTAISQNSKIHLLGRTLDLECSFFEKVIITPRNYSFCFAHTNSINNHYAIIGIGIIENNYPLYYDAVNEMGLGIAGLNFPDNAIYNDEKSNSINVASYEFIPYLLSTCKNVDEVLNILKDINVTNRGFNDKYPPSPLHWMISDKNKSITVEPLADGIKIYDNPVGVLTNNPRFDYQLFSLNNFGKITPYESTNNFSDCISLEKYSRGLGGLGLPGDLSSNSRFIRACYTKCNSISPEGENGDISQFFHILEVVSQTRGSVRLNDGSLEQTVYTSCCDTKNLVYYFTTYCNRQINAVQLFKEDVDASNLIGYNIEKTENIKFIN